MLARSQASASSATVEARELCRDHLQTFGRLEDGCTTLAQELGRAAAAAAAAGEKQDVLLSKSKPEFQNECPYCLVLRC